MSFKENSYQQLTFTDSFMNLTAREKKALDNSWAKVFAENIFPYINEKPYAALYSSVASRPNSPINVAIGAMIIKEVFGLSDDEVLENLLLDIRYQYALHTTSFEEQPMSDKTLSRLRRRCYDYETTTGIDLIHETMTELADAICKLMKVTPDIKRMDSMMIEANIKKLSRLELLYTCVAKLCLYLKNKADVELPDELIHYTEDNDFNKVIYHNKSDESDDKILAILKDADKLLEICDGSYQDVTEYQLFVRCIGEQTVIDKESGDRRLKTKEDGEMGAQILQNPSDPDATFRTKAGKDHRGYAGNVVETVGQNGSVVTDYQLEENTYSDSQFLNDYINRQDDNQSASTMVTDGAYSGENNVEAAAKKNIKLVTTDLLGRDADSILKKFEIDEASEKIEKCPAGNTPLKSRYDKKQQKYLATMDRECCANCPLRDKCKAKVHKRVANITISKTSLARAATREYMQTEEFKNLARIRNGVETIPSLLRNKFNVDKMPRGKQHSRLFFGCKIGALNFKKLMTYLKGRGNYAQNPILTGTAC